MKTARVLLSSIGFFLIAASLLLSIIDLCCFDRSFYHREYQKNDAMQETGMSLEDLIASTDVLLDYLRDQRDDINVAASVDGRERDVFNKRETLHMIDVKALYQNALQARNCMLAGGCALAAAAVFSTDKKTRKSFLKKTYQYGTSADLACLGFLVTAALADFDSFWRSFHRLFFDNDLWLLDPNTSLMINMFPGTFFFDLVFKIIVIYVIVLIALTCAICKLSEVKPKRQL